MIIDKKTLRLLRKKLKDKVERNEYGEIVSINGIFIPSGANTKYLKFFKYDEIFEMIYKLSNNKFLRIVNNKSFYPRRIKSKEDLEKIKNSISFRKRITHSIIVKNKEEIIKKLLYLIVMIKNKKIFDFILDYLKKIDVLFDFYVVKLKDRYRIKRNTPINGRQVKFKIVNLSSKNEGIL